MATTSNISSPNADEKRAQRIDRWRHPQIDFVTPDATQLPEGYPGKEAMVKFSADLFAKFNEPATLFSAASADTINMLIEGLKAGGDDKEKVRATIEGLQDWQGLQGVFNHSPTNHEGLKGGYCEWQILDGKFMFVRALN